MEVKLENLIEKLKKEGVDGAQQASDEILKKARREADLIITEAKKEAASIVEDAKNQSSKLEENSRLALQQAARDSVLLLKERLISLFDSVFKREVSDVLKPDLLKEIILMIIAQWTENPQVEIVLNKNEIQKLEKFLFQGLREELRESISIKPSSDFDKGFRIGIKGEDTYYDFSDESITQLLVMFLNPRVREILDK